jgi:hypothetical protein
LVKFLIVKKLLLLILLCIPSFSFGQYFWTITFENNPSQFQFQNRIVRDTVRNPFCSWQIGKPRKPVFDSAYRSSRAIVTDTAHPVRPRDTSAFILKHTRTSQVLGAGNYFNLEFNYKLDGDSTDFGRIEISPDSGRTWIDLLAEDTTYGIYWSGTKPTLKGKAPSWTSVSLNMTRWANASYTGNWQNYPVLMTADTILFRFTYITGADTTPRDGWMMDDIHLIDAWEGIEETPFSKSVRLYPTPASRFLTVDAATVFTAPTAVVYDATGKRVATYSPFSSPLNVQQYPNGLYFLYLEEGAKRALKRFTIAH